MANRLGDYVAKRARERQEAIKKRTAELIAEEATLRQGAGSPASGPRCKSPRSCTSIKRPSSKLRTPYRRVVSLCTLHRGDGAISQLEIVARFPDQAVRITQFEALDPEQRPQS